MTLGNAEDGWDGLLGVEEATSFADTNEPYLDGDADEITLEEDLPFTRFKLPPEEEDFDTIHTGTFQCYLYLHPSIDACAANSSGMGSRHP